MSVLAVLIIVIGLPLILIGIGFVIMATKIFNGDGGQAERAQTLEVARQLERTLSALESRLTALEDIILAGSATREGGRDDRQI